MCCSKWLLDMFPFSSPSGAPLPGAGPAGAAYEAPAALPRERQLVWLWLP